MTGITDESAPVTFDDEWERRAEQRLEETEFDTELGLELARDVQEVIAGEMSECEFREKYHDAVREEFGEDAREIAGLDAIGDDTETAASLEDRSRDFFEDEESRRSFVKKGGVAAMGLSMLLGGGDSPGESATAAAAADDEDDEGTRYGMTINLNNCDGCLACMAACKQEHGLSRGAHWMYVLTYEDEDQADENFLVRPCQHCTNSPCTKVCPVGARHTRKEDGLVLTDYDICIGCRYCEVSCPYGVNYFQWGEPDVPDEEIDPSHQIDERGRWVGARPPKGVMGKCTFCADRQDGQMGEEKIGTTACEEACSMNAIHFGDLNDPDSAPNKHLEQYRGSQQNDLSAFPNRTDDTVSTFKLLEERGTSPNIHYIGNEPSQHARQVPGPVTYEEVGLVDNRKDAVLDDGPTATNGGEQA